MSSNWIARQTSLKRALCRSNWIRVRSRWKWTPGQKKIQMSENKQQRCSAKIFEAVFFCCCQACKTRSGGFCLSIRWKILVNFQKTWKWERSLSCLAQIDTGESCFLSLPLSAFFACRYIEQSRTVFGSECGELRDTHRSQEIRDMAAIRCIKSLGCRYDRRKYSFWKLPSYRLSTWWQ